MSDNLYELQLSKQDPEVQRTFDETYLKILRHQNNDLPLQYLVNFLHKAQLHGADPRKNQIYLTTHFSKNLGHKVGTPVFSYTYLLELAMKTGEYLGYDEPIFKWEVIKNPFTKEEAEELTCTIKMHRKNKGSVTYKAIWSEHVNNTNPMWKAKPYFFLEKCALAACIRRMFPESTSGVYIDEEIPGEKAEVKGDHIDLAPSHVTTKSVEEIIDATKDHEEKQQVIDSIIACAKIINNGKENAQKFLWMQERLEVLNFSDLKKKTLDELKTTLKLVEDESLQEL
jgi:hypothetical protein